jgi:hypothetical protein
MNDIDYLNRNNQELIDLYRRYELINHPATENSLWISKYRIEDINLSSFRADNAYLWQTRNTQDINYLATAFYIQDIDKQNLLERLHEDGEFGCYTTLFKRKKISRDLLDSITEYYFLEKHLNISKLGNIVIADIGAGYGRFAHRLTEVLKDKANVFCFDAIPESTFLSTFYLKFRNSKNSTVIPLDKINGFTEKEIFLAVNIHSFSECCRSTIRWWLTWLRSKRTRYLFIVPNFHMADDIILSRESDGNFLNYYDLLTNLGYQKIVSSPKFSYPEIQKHGIYPTYYYLFELKE